jgi:hypothetical protein
MGGSLGLCGGEVEADDLMRKRLEQLVLLAHTNPRELLLLFLIYPLDATLPDAKFAAASRCGQVGRGSRARDSKPMPSAPNVERSWP